MGSPRAAHAIPYTSAGATWLSQNIYFTTHISFAIVIAEMQELALGKVARHGECSAASVPRHTVPLSEHRKFPLFRRQ
jgi:hypothetical protein